MSPNRKSSKRVLILCVSTIVLLIACVFLNINMRNSVTEDDYEMIDVLVLDVRENYSGTNTMTTERTITVKVSYDGNEVELKNAPGSQYNYYKNNVRKMIPVCLYKGTLYSAPENIVTAAGGVYFVCLGLFVLSLVLTIYFRRKDKFSQK